MPCKVQIYSPKGSKALDYVLGFIFDDFFGCGFELISKRASLSHNAVVFNYSNEVLDGVTSIIPNGYLFENELKLFPEIELTDWKGLPSFFNTGGTIPFDLFSAIFFLLSRAEEYANAVRDKHSRFSATNSLFDADFIQRPIIDEWLTVVGKLFLSNSDLTVVERKFQWINTYDIDVAYAYRHRPLMRIIAASGRNIMRLDFKAFFERFKVLLGNIKDPYDTYLLQREISESYADETIYFFLLGDKSEYDRNLSHMQQGMHSLVSSTSEYAEVGIHPSYASNKNPHSVKIEMQRLENVLQKPITRSRQHFLKLELPATYRKLIENGIKADYTMGYADLPGFRSGTCTPHFFFDLESMRKTELRIFPLMIMEASLRDYMKLSKSDAKRAIKAISNRVKAVNGQLITLWHNDSLSDSSDNYWRDLYVEMAKDLKSN